MTAAEKLAAALITWDEDYPGDPDATMEIPADTWAEWIDLAGQIEQEEST